MPVQNLGNGYAQVYLCQVTSAIVLHFWDVFEASAWIFGTC